MAFPRAPLRAPRPPRVRASVFAVGRHVFVSAERSAGVALTDDAGKVDLGSVSDGTEVAILGWRPGSAESARYHVRTTDSGREGWLAVGNLRATEVAPPRMHPERVDEVTAFNDNDPPRPFGGRRF
jgi:hypothetical protein